MPGGAPNYSCGHTKSTNLFVGQGEFFVPNQCQIWIQGGEICQKTLSKPYSHNVFDLPNIFEF